MENRKGKTAYPHPVTAVSFFYFHFPFSVFLARE